MENTGKRKLFEEFEERFTNYFDEYVFVMDNVVFVDGKIVSFEDGRVYATDNTQHIVASIKLRRHDYNCDVCNVFSRIPYQQFEYFTKNIFESIKQIESRLNPIEETETPAEEVVEVVE